MLPISTTQIWITKPIKQLSILLCPRLWQPSFYFLSLNLTVPGSSCKWNHAILVFFWLAFLSIMSSKMIHVAACNWIFYLFKSNIYAAFCLSIHVLMGTWIASTFWLLSLWTWVYKYIAYTLISVVIGWGGLLDLMVILFVVFWRTNILFSTVVAPFYIQTDVRWSLTFELHFHDD